MASSTAVLRHPQRRHRFTIASQHRPAHDVTIDAARGRRVADTGDEAFEVPVHAVMVASGRVTAKAAL